MKVMTVRAPDELQNSLKKQADSMGLTRNALVLQVLWEWQHNMQQESEKKKEKVGV